MQRKRHNESQEDYLEGIYVVTKRKGYCCSVDLAEELGYSKASVSVAVSKPLAAGVDETESISFLLMEFLDSTPRRKATGDAVKTKM